MNYAVLFVNGETKGKGIVVYGETQYINILTTKNIKK